MWKPRGAFLPQRRAATTPCTVCSPLVIPRLGVLGWEAAAWSRCARKIASRRWKPGPLASCSCAPRHRKPKATGCRQTAESGKMMENGGRSQSALSACPHGGPRQPLSGTRRRGNYRREKRGRGSFHNYPPLLRFELRREASSTRLFLATVYILGTTAAAASRTVLAGLGPGREGGISPKGSTNTHVFHRQAQQPMEDADK